MTNPRRVPRPVLDNVIRIVGMHGLGDNLHQRAIVKELMRNRIVHLETPWPSIYHDLVGRNLKLVRKTTMLRTQAKNMQREAAKYSNAAPFGVNSVRIWYRGAEVVQAGSILAAMCINARVRERDFRLPVPDEWKNKTMHFLHGKWTNGKPLLVYRPLVMRKEWGGCAARNPDFDAYAEIFNAIRDQFYVVSIADLVPGVEWVVGHDVKADLELHKGELTFETLAGLFARASMSYASPGFATILAQAVGTPSICVFGGHENSLTVAGGARLTPTLSIDPVASCNCFSNHHACDKTIDIPRAIAAVKSFVARSLEVKQYGDDSSGACAQDDRQLGFAF
jgi:hypothetical protein